MTKPKMTRDEIVDETGHKIEDYFNCQGRTEKYEQPFPELLDIIQSALTEHGAEKDKEIERLQEEQDLRTDNIQ